MAASRRIAGPLFGIEAELAVGARRAGEGLPVDAVVMALARAAQRTLVHLPDGGGRMFLGNGGLFYVDVGAHPEIATPECRSPADAVAYKLAGERIVAGLAQAARGELEADSVQVYRANLDYAGATWGCHESYLARRGVTRYQAWLVPHLVSRIVFTGSGGLDPGSPGIRTSLSPRAAYIDHVVSHDSMSHRGVVHTKDEPLCRGYSRIHVLVGDNACSQRATWLKVGTTALVVALADSGASSAGWPVLADPVRALHGFARDPEHRTAVRLGRGKSTPMTAVEIQRHVLARVEAAADGGFPPWAADVCAAWRQALDSVELPPSAPGGAAVFDWTHKFELFQREMGKRGFTAPAILAWTEALECLLSHVPAGPRLAGPLDRQRVNEWRASRALHAADRDQATRLLMAQDQSWERLDDFIALRRQLCAIDLRFGEIGGGIFDTLDRQGLLAQHRVVDEDRVRQAVGSAPSDSRAHLRGHWVKQLHGGPEQFRCGWQEIRGESTRLDLLNPFATKARWRPCEALPASRYRAYEHYHAGRYVEAERELNRLLEGGQEPANTHCHLARVSLVTGRVGCARRHAAQAWARRGTAALYVVARILWIRLAITGVEPGDEAASATARLIGQLKWLLQNPGDVVLDWTAEPMLDRLAPQLDADQHALLGALVAALSDGRLEVLEQLEVWRAHEPVAISEVRD